MKRRPIKDQQLENLESEFRPLLISCLEECGNGRWGLFGQNDDTRWVNYFRWQDGERLKKKSLSKFAL